jgi:hypothetical protein
MQRVGIATWCADPFETLVSSTRYEMVRRDAVETRSARASQAIRTTEGERPRDSRSAASVPNQQTTANPHRDWQSSGGVEVSDALALHLVVQQRSALDSRSSCINNQLTRQQQELLFVVRTAKLRLCHWCIQSVERRFHARP